MAYDDKRAYVGTFTLAAQNVVMTASGAIAPGTTSITNVPAGESTYLVSVCGVVTATPSAFPAGVRAYAVVGTATSTGTGFITQTTASGFVCTFIPPVALGSVGGNVATIGLVATGTASATQTLAATTLIAGFAPQFV